MEHVLTVVRERLYERLYIGEVVPKGFEEPVRLYEVNWQEEA